MLNKKNISIFLISALVGAAAIYIIPLTNAAAGDPLGLSVCEEGVFLFKLGGAAPTGDTSKYIYKLSESTCKQHAPYPNAHYQLTNNDKTTHPVTQDAKNDNIHSPYTRQHHIFYNNSLEDNFFYKGYVAKFEITVEQDGYEKTQFGELQCPVFTGQTGTIYNNFRDCVDQAYDPNHYGGIRLHKKTVGNTIVITWEFGVKGQGGRPWTPGINPSIDNTPAPGFPIKFNFDSTNPFYRSWPEYVQMKTKENLPESIWSATTTSRILIADAAIHRNAVSTNPALDKWNVADPTCMQGWCLLDPSTYVNNPQIETVYSNGNPKKYYWYEIGTVSTVWNKEAPPSYCTGLQITAPGTLEHLGGNWYKYIPDTDATFQVLPSFSDFEVPLDYKWNAKEYKINLGIYEFEKGITIGESDDKLIKLNYTKLLQTNLLALNIQDVASQSVSQPGGITIQDFLAKYGLFYDNESERYSNPSAGSNPYVDKDNLAALFGPFDDRATYYTGGPEGTLIQVQGVNPQSEQYVGNNCEAFIIIPTVPKPNSCIDLTINPDSLDPYTPQTFTVTPAFEDPGNPLPLDYYWNTSNQPSPCAPERQPPAAPEGLEIVDDDDDGITLQRIPVERMKVNDDDDTPIIDRSMMELVEIQPTFDPVTMELRSLGSTNLLAAAAPESPITAVSPFATSPGIEIGDGDAQPPQSIYDMYEDYLGAGDLANPYWETNDNMTHYTGGAPGTYINVQAYDKDGTLYPLCCESLQIPVKECLDLEILRDGAQVPNPLAVGEPTDNLYVAVLTDPAAYVSELEYVWETNNGTLSNGQSGQQAITQNPADEVDLTNGVDGTTVDVYAREKANPNTILRQCADAFTLQGVPENICLDLQLSNTNPNLQAGESTSLQADPINQNPPHPTDVNLAEIGPGHFSIGAGSQLYNNMFPGTCPTPPIATNQTFTAPMICDYIYHAGSEGGGSFRVEAQPNLGNVAECIFEYDVPTTPDIPYCVDLDIDPDTINRGDRTTYTGNATFSDGKTYNIDLEWSGQNGTFSNGSTFQIQNNIPSNSLSNYFDHTPENASGRVTAEVTKAYNSNITDFSRCTEIITIESEKVCTYLYLKWADDDLVCIGTDHEGDFIWGIGDSTETNDELCIPATRDDEITVEAIGFEDICADSYSPDDIPPEFDLKKRISIEGEDGGYTSKIVTIPQDHTNVWYQLVFTPSRGDITTVTIIDDISERGFLEAEILPVDAAGNVSPGIITYKGPIQVWEKGWGDLERCSDVDWDNDEPEHCYNRDIDRTNGIELVRIDDEVTITYRATVESGLTDEICRNGQVCEEKYVNRAGARITEVNDKIVEIFRTSNQIEIQIFCQYILTRAAGDIFLERDLSYGVDIQQCSEFKNIPGVVIVPDQPDKPIIVSVGQGDATIFKISHELCTAGTAGELIGALKDAYGQDVAPSLSGQICEVKLRIGEAWKQEFITNSIDENKTRLSRWGYDYEKSETNIAEITIDQNYDSKSIFHIKGDLLIDSPQTFSDGDGAKTFIIEGDLIIKDKITYGECNKTICTVRDTASLAFIVLGGNVYIDPDVTEISGVYFVQESEDHPATTGKLYSGAPGSTEEISSDSLKVYGSIYGDIDPLFEYRKFAGDPTKDEGGIVIRFDERIIINTPPGLRDVLNLSQTEVAR